RIVNDHHFTKNTANTNQNGTGNVVAARAEGTGNKNQASMHPHPVLSLTRLPSMTQTAQLRYNSMITATNEIFNIFIQEEQYTDLLEPIPEPQLVPHNDNQVISVTSSMVQSG
nr:hypothetical protein [Tanacetum cinerariifolium]